MKNTQQRISPDMTRDLKEAMRIRAIKGLTPMTNKGLGLPKATELARRTKSWANLLEELKTKPEGKKE